MTTGNFDAEHSLRAAEPSFTRCELDTLFQLLGVQGDPSNSEDRARAIDVLNETLADQQKTEKLLAEFQGHEVVEDEDVAPHPVPGDRFEPVRILHAHTDVHRSFMDEPLSEGRLLTAVRAASKQPSNLETPPTFFFSTSRGADHRDRDAAGDELESEYRLTRVQSRSTGSEFTEWVAFVSQARHALSHRKTWPWRKFLWRLRDDTSQSSLWGSSPDRLNLEVRHGEKLWKLLVVFENHAMVVQIRPRDKAAIETKVTPGNPVAFSNELVDAFDGDVIPAEMALSSLQWAFSVSEPHSEGLAN